jgi:hypothetical protein
MKVPDLPTDPFVATGIVELERISKLVGIEEKLRKKKGEDGRDKEKQVRADPVLSISYR